MCLAWLWGVRSLDSYAESGAPEVHVFHVLQIHLRFPEQLVDVLAQPEISSVRTRAH